MVMHRVRFEVLGNPVPKARARTVRKGGRTWSFTPKKVSEWEDKIRSKAKEHFEHPYSSPVCLSLTFHMKRPESRVGETYVHTTPDLDNLEKAILDGLNEVAYEDDRLVVVKISQKIYVRQGKPRVTIVVINLDRQSTMDNFF